MKHSAKTPLNKIAHLLKFVLKLPVRRSGVWSRSDLYEQDRFQSHTGVNSPIRGNVADLP